VSVSSVIDDVANRKLLQPVLDMAGGGELPLERLHRLACGSATSMDVEEFGDHWTRTPIDLE
jgi:hypothetical protein